ncbi:MAG: anaerobic ribonucleoside-triphosphate reductase [Intestinibacter sp.]|nr:anaerobic ribonucleoside-triphosphate reductase [Intestinibacter sp.]MDY2737879.1 anaerobic ribonucleoside-triphosphate reductase [Intestinibacter sp.]
MNDIEIRVKAPEGITISEEEKKAYLEHIKKNNPHRQIEWVEIAIDDEGYANLTYSLAPKGFERIRRITGYLVGTTEKWNDGKKAELKDRVKHSCCK